MNSQQYLSRLVALDARDLSKFGFGPKLNWTGPQVRFSSGSGSQQIVSSAGPSATTTRTGRCPHLA